MNNFYSKLVNAGHQNTFLGEKQDISNEIAGTFQNMVVSQRIRYIKHQVTIRTIMVTEKKESTYKPNNGVSCDFSDGFRKTSDGDQNHKGGRNFRNVELCNRRCGFRGDNQSFTGPLCLPIIYYNSLTI